MILTTSDQTLKILKTVCTWAGWTAQEIAEEVGESLATTKNHLETLIKHSLIEHTEKDHYFPGDALWALGIQSVKNLQRRSAELNRKMDKALEALNG